MAEPRILIVVKDAEAGGAYGEALCAAGAGFDIASSFTQMSNLAVEKEYNGLLIDILTLVRSSNEEKVIAYDCINLYPVLRVKWENKKKKITLSPLEQAFSPDTASVLKYFIEERCRPFAPRRLRKHNRKNFNLNVLLSRDGLFSENDTLKTFTLNVSMGGAFLHTTEPLQREDQVWLRLAEFPELPPIAATVRWVLAWGESRSVPGVGVRFEELTDAQEQVLQAITG